MKKFGVFLCLLFFIAFVRTEDAPVINESLNVTTEKLQEHPTNSTTEHNLDDSSPEEVNKTPDHPVPDIDTNSSDYYNDDAMNPEGGYEEINSNYTAHQEEEPTSTFALEWEEKMKDYEPDYVYMIPVGYKKREVFYENITHVPVTIRGAFLTDEDKKDKIEFAIMDPHDNVILANATNEWIFSFNVTVIGFYKIIFHNTYVNSNIKVTFTMNTGQNPMLKKHDLTFVEEKLFNLLKFVKKFQLEFKVTRNNQVERTKKINKTNKYFYTFSVIETIILICISIWQFYYIKQLLEIKSSC